MKTSVKLNLKNHCIETASKRYLDKLIKQAMDEEEPNEELEKTIHMMQRILNSMDFAYLRSSDERLAGGKDVNVILYDEYGEIRLKVEEKDSL